MLLAWPAAAGRVPRQRPARQRRAASRRSGGGLADRYPLSAYALDYHVDVGVTEPEGVPPMIAQWAAAQLWSVTSFLVKSVIDLFTWAFSLDLLGGADGALAPIGEAITSLYENVIGEAWMVAAILIAGLWGIWKALVQRRYTETAGALGALRAVRADRAVLRLPARAHRRRGEPRGRTRSRSPSCRAPTAARSTTRSRPSTRSPTTCSTRSSTSPWVVLEFGGLSHCVDTDRLDDDGFPRPVGPHDPARDVCRDHVAPGRDGHGGYAPRYLRQAPGSEERKAEYDALRRARRRATTRSSPATASTRPTRPRSTSSRPAARSSG